MITNGGAVVPTRCHLDVELAGSEAIDDEGMLAAIQTLGGLHPLIAGSGHGAPVLPGAGRALFD